MLFNRFLAALAAIAARVDALAVADPEYGIYTSENGRYFTHLDGSPFFWQADTAWLLFHRLNSSELEMYLEDRASKGYNMVLVTGVTQLGLDDANRNGDLPLIDEDFTQPNEPYWQEVDSMVELAWEYGIRIAFVPAWGYHVHLESDEAGGLNESNAYAFGSWFGERYPFTPKLLVGDTNPYWTNKTAMKSNYAAGGVPQLYKYTNYSAVYDALATGLKSAEPKSQITIHCTNQWYPNTPVALASAFFDHADWLDFDSSQSGHADFPPNPPIEWWNARRGYESIQLMYQKTYATKTRPVLDNEPHYENRYNNGKDWLPYWNASDIRIGSYQSVFTGAAGLAYGSDNVMQIYIPSLWESAGTGPADSWDVDLNLAGAGQMQFIKQVVQDRAAYPNLVPWTSTDIPLIVGDIGYNDTYVAALVDTQIESCILVYTPTGSPFTLNLRQFNTNAGEAGWTGRWFNPLDGSYQDLGSESKGEEGLTDFTPPTASDHSDWVLVLERRDS